MKGTFIIYKRHEQVEKDKYLHFHSLHFHSTRVHFNDVINTNLNEKLYCQVNLACFKNGSCQRFLSEERTPSRIDLLMALQVKVTLPYFIKKSWNKFHQKDSTFFNYKFCLCTTSHSSF